MSIIPWYWKAGAALLAVAAVLAAGDAYLSHRDAVADKAGYERADGEWRQREACIAQAVQKHVADETKQARSETAALQEKFDNLADIRQKENAHHEEDKRAAVSRALAGTERLRIPTGPATSDPVRKAGDSESAELGTGVATAPSAVLLPATAAAILYIAGDYGQLVRDYNTVVDRYADIERACNATGRAAPVTTQPIGE